MSGHPSDMRLPHIRCVARSRTIVIRFGAGPVLVYLYGGTLSQQSARELIELSSVSV